ncbi:hypothetical protein T484DRAFT_1597717, partial [Baffinella frigidus]
VQEQGCKALRNLALNNENRAAIARAGGIEAVVAGMGAHTLFAEVQRSGCAALGNLSFNNNENKTVIARAGG